MVAGSDEGMSTMNGSCVDHGYIAIDSFPNEPHACESHTMRTLSWSIQCLYDQTSQMLAIC